MKNDNIFDDIFGLYSFFKNIKDKKSVRKSQRLDHDLLCKSMLMDNDVSKDFITSTSVSI